MVIESVYIFDGTSLLTIFDSYLDSLEGKVTKKTIYRDIVCKTNMINYLLDKTLSDEFGLFMVWHESPTNTYVSGVPTSAIVDTILETTNVPNWSICKKIADIVTNTLRDYLVKNYRLYVDAHICNSNIHVMIYLKISK